MERFKLKNGDLCPPPRNGVCAAGHAVSNFAARVARDAAFAAQNGYFPKSPAWPPVPNELCEPIYELREGEWHCRYEPLATQTKEATDFV